MITGIIINTFDCSSFSDYFVLNELTYSEEPTRSINGVMDDLSKKQAYKKFAYRGLDITKLISLTPDEVAQNLRSRQ